jgi:S1-C subfamily serine protease
MTTLEDLNKTQIVLLVLLLSFITSIATGVITAALLAQAPEGVTQTINRVIEHTIETVTPSATSTPTVTHEVTVIKEDDAVAAAIAATRDGVIKLMVRGSDGNPQFYALGAIVDKNGTVVSDGQGLVLDGTYTAVLSDGTQVPAAVVSRTADQSLAVFKLMSGDPRQTYSPIPLAASDPKLGETVIAYEGTSDVGVDVGRATILSTASDKSVKAVMTDIAARGEAQGAPLVDLSGELVGVKSSSADMSLPAGLYTALGPIRAAVALPPASRP